MLNLMFDIVLLSYIIISLTTFILFIQILETIRLSIIVNYINKTIPSHLQ